MLTRQTMEFLKKVFARNVPSDGYEVFFRCDGCLETIEDGAKRYNCVDCVQSYDLCKKCHSCGKAESHTAERGPQHTFVPETQSHMFTSTFVHQGTTLEHLISNMFKYYGARPAVGQYDASKDCYVYLTFTELCDSVKAFGSGLKKLQLDRGLHHSMISMCSVSRLEWYLTDIACLLLGVPTVPLGANSNSDQMKYILNKAEVSIVVCSSDILRKEMVKILPDCPSVKIVILMDLALTCNAQDLEGCEKAIPDSICGIKFTEVMALGRRNPINVLKKKHKPTDIYTVQFTSGSTGDPKGCVFSRSTWKSRIAKGTILGRLNVWLSFHPPSHNLERGSFFVTLLNGGKIGIYRGSMEHLYDDFALVRPTIVASTPRLWTMMYNQYLQELQEAFVKQQTDHEHPDFIPEFPDPNKGRDPATDSENTPGATSSDVRGHDLRHFNVEKVPADLRKAVMSRFKSKLGGREKMITTGGAPTGKMVKRFIIDCFEGMVNDGYGSTEVGGIASDGSVHPSSDVKLIDVPEMGYFTTDKPPRGEICVKTPSMIDGYFRSPDITAEKFVDGYFLTGDIGVMEKESKLRIIDRKKNIFKLSQGEFVSPERLELVYTEASCCISQVYIYGNSLQSNVVAVVVPEEEEVLKIGKSLHEDGKDFHELCQSPSVKEQLLKEIRLTATENSLPGWEVPVDVLLEPSPFTVENGLLTSTLKKSRFKLEQKYKTMLEVMYERINNSDTNRPLEMVVFEWIRKQFHCNREVSELPDEDEIDFKKSFSQLGGDSLSAMHLSSLLREHLSLDLPVDVILKTPLADVISDACGVKGAPVHHDWSEEASLDSLGLDTILQCSSPRDVPEVSSSVLLTGCTGFLGRFILWELLQDSKITGIFCLAQNRKEVCAKDRVLKILDQLQLELGEDTVQEIEKKLVVMVGDLSKPKLGLCTEDYRTLCEEVDTIIHNGATVNSVLPYAALKRCNVESTKELMRMAVTTRSKFLHYVSTIGVFSPAQSGVDESVKPMVDRLDTLSGYSQSKWVAESPVLAAISQGKINGNVSRPGLIGPHTKTGHANLQDWVCWLVRGLAKLGMAPTGRGCDEKQIHWVPVDQTAKAIALVSSDNRGCENDESDNLYHLVNSNTPVAFSALIDVLVAMHSLVKTTSYEEFRGELHRRCKASDDQVLGSLDLLLPRVGGWPLSPAHHSMAHKMERWEGAGIHMGLLHDRYVEQYLVYVGNHGHLAQSTM